MKNVLLIELHPNYGMGGVENYNRKLSHILEDNFKNILVDHVALLPCENFNQSDLIKQYYHVFNENTSYLSKNGNFNFPKLSFLFLKFRTLVYKLYKQNHYDLIIDSTIASFKKFMNQDFYFWVQHNTPSYYSLQYIKDNLTRNLFLFGEWFFGVFNNLIHTKNLVLFDQYNYNEIKANRSTSFNGYIIPLSNYVPNNFDKTLIECAKSRQRIIYFGRIDNFQKNISLLIEVNKKIHLIDFYGKGDSNLIKELGDSYKGYLANNENLQTLFTKYKFMIIMSNYEGFPFSIVQSLCYGLPVIMRNTFTSAQYLTNNQQNGFLLDPNLTVDEYAKQILGIYQKDDDQYLKLSLNAYHFALNNLSDEQFEQKWLRIFHKYLDE